MKTSLRLSPALTVCALVATLLTSGVACLSQAMPAKHKTAGTYVDGDGGRHEWMVNTAHTLIWDNEPYIPVGGVFASRYISLGATQENLDADVAALAAIRSRGINDILLKATGPITATDPAAWQEIVELLDANGFHYGIEMNDGPRDPLRGYLVAPNAYMVSGPYPETVLSWKWPDVDAAIYVVVKRLDLSVKYTGGALVRDGSVTVNLAEPIGSGEMLIVYPRKVLAGSGYGDIWSGFGEYRDRLLAFLGQIKFGPGLRFFLEPFTGKMDFRDEMLGFVPDSSGFRVGLEAYLTKRHVHEGAVNAAWGVNDNLEKIEVAARLVPLWTSRGGISQAYDRAAAQLFPIDTTVSQAWIDIINYRDASVQEFMNTIADTLKKQVANVPVIFKTSGYHRVYANPYGIGGFDGLGAEAYGSADVPVTSVAGPAYALAEESAKSTWFIVSATATSADNKLLAGYPNANVMGASLDYFREIGCKGFFVDSLQALPEGRANFSLLSDPQQLDWLREFKDKVNAKAWPEFRPEVVWFPANSTTGAHVSRLARDTWWLPTLRGGKSTYLGDTLAAYTLAGEDRSYLWSLSGEQTITLKTPPTGVPTVVFPAGATVTAAKKKGEFQVVLNQTPTVLRGMDLAQMFPYETAAVQVEQLAALIPEADRQGFDVRQAKAGLDRAKTVISNGQPLIGHGIAQQSTDELLKLMGADLWVEGEQPSFSYFGTAAASPGASSANALVLDTDRDPPLSPYTVIYRFAPPANASYEIWIAATPPGEGSPVSFTTDDVNWTPLTAGSDSVNNYAPGLAWYRIGTVNAFPGNQVLQFRADGRRTQDSRYYFRIDAVVLSPKGFAPNGIHKPF